jgi:hypothetical protein
MAWQVGFVELYISFLQLLPGHVLRVCQPTHIEKTTLVREVCQTPLADYVS